jgi:hypothetical protein
MAIDGSTCQPFSARTLSPFHGFSFQDNRGEIIQSSRQRYAGKRDDMEGNEDRLIHFEKIWKQKCVV